MHKTLTLITTSLAAGAALIAAPAYAQLGGQVGGDVGVGGTIGADTGPVTNSTADTLNRTTNRTQNTVNKADSAVNQSTNRVINGTEMSVVSQSDVTTGTTITDADGNSVGTVQSVDSSGAVVVRDNRKYKVPLASIYKSATGTATGLTTIIPQARFDAAAQAQANANADADAGG